MGSSVADCFSGVSVKQKDRQEQRFNTGMRLLFSSVHKISCKKSHPDTVKACMLSRYNKFTLLKLTSSLCMIVLLLIIDN